MARPDGNPHREGKKILGAVHFALGTGLSTGGIYKSTLHLDGSISPPKIYVDDDLFFDEGRLLA
jgi:leucyl aminopeptidase (aminopeptidase T)